MFYFKDQKDGFYAVASLDVRVPADAVEITAAEAAILQPPPDPAIAARSAKDAADTAATKLDAKLQALAAMSPEQARAWINTNVTNLADAKDALGTLAAAVVVLARRL